MRTAHARLLGHRAGDRARVALEVVGEVGGAEQVRAERRLERARLLGLEQLAAHARRGQPLEPRGLGRERRGVAVDEQRALAANAGALAVAPLDVVVGGHPEHGEVELRARFLVRAQHVALAEPGRPARDLARVDQVHLDAARGERAGRRGADDAGADHDDAQHV